jgi:hypothetical protein
MGSRTSAARGHRESLRLAAAENIGNSSDNSPALQRWANDCAPVPNRVPYKDESDSRAAEKGNSFVPVGTRRFVIPRFPALKRWAIFRKTDGNSSHSWRPRPDHARADYCRSIGAVRHCGCDRTPPATAQKQATAVAALPAAALRALSHWPLSSLGLATDVVTLQLRNGAHPRERKNLLRRNAGEGRPTLG